VLVELPASGWSRIGGSALKEWRFKDRTGPIRSVVVKQDQITIKSGKGGWSYTLDEQQQGSAAVRLRLGNTDGWCANVPALAKNDPQPTAESDHPGLFKGEHKAPAPEACPENSRATRAGGGRAAPGGRGAPPEGGRPVRPRGEGGAARLRPVPSQRARPGLLDAARTSERQPAQRLGREPVGAHLERDPPQHLIEV